MKPVMDPWDEGRIRLFLREYLNTLSHIAAKSARPFNPRDPANNNDYARGQYLYWSHVAAAMEWAKHLAETSLFEKVRDNGFEYVEPSPDQSSGNTGDSSTADSTRSGIGEDPFAD